MERAVVVALLNRSDIKYIASEPLTLICPYLFVSILHLASKLPGISYGKTRCIYSVSLLA